MKGEKTEVEDSGEEGKGGTGIPEDKRHGTGRAEPPLEVSEQIGQARVKETELGRKQKALNGQRKHLDLH